MTIQLVACNFHKMKALAILLALACGAIAGPVRNRVCSESLDARFLPSKKYVYRYVGTSSTGIEGVTDEKAEIKITARCHVNPVQSNVFELTVDDVGLTERSSPHTQFTLSRGNEAFKKDLEDHRLTFTVMKGRIVSIRTSKAEPGYATNIKRGMLSALQLEFKEDGESTVNERDISGDCKTRYLRITKDGNEDIYKVKNLTECTNRSNVDTMMHPVFYTTNSGKRTLLDCTSSCHYKVACNKIMSVECKETHLLRPFSYQSAGVMTRVTQKMELEDESSHSSYSSALDVSSSQESDLKFDFNPHEKLQQHFQGDISSVEKILRDFVEMKPSKETSWVAPMAYTKLVFQLRRLDLQGIENIWRKYYECSNGWQSYLCTGKERTEEQRRMYKQLVVDSLSQCGTVACVRFIDLKLRSSLNVAQGMNSDLKQLLTGLAWVRNPTEPILNTFWSLLKDMRPILPENTITILGSMMRTHCEVYPKNCDYSMRKLPIVLQISRYFIDQLYINVDLCSATTETVDSMIYTLRAIGNSHYMDASTSELVSCALKANYKNISAVALQVLGDLDQDYETRKGLKQMYKDYGQDPELRMLAYLAWMKTPTKEDIKTAVETLEGEINTQVGSLVWSHLTSMNTSVEPTSGKSTAKMIKEVLKEIQKPLRHFTTKSKSTVWHKSTFNEHHNLGVSADGHVIYHPESLLPRHAHFNMTVDVLGGAFSVFEASTRTEGFELIWDRLFGPDGHFPDKHISDLVRAKEPSNRINKRSPGNGNYLEDLHDKVNMPKPTPSGLFSIKLFGNELTLFTVKDLEWLDHEIPLLDWVDLLRDLKNGVDKTYTKHLLFLHDSFTIPTSIGLPMNLKLNGTATGSIHVMAKGDLLSLFWGRTNIKFKGMVQPSAAVSLSGMMSVNAFHSMVGIQLNSTMFTSTNVSANVTYKEGEKLKFHYHVVEKPQETFNISSMIFKQVNDNKTPIKGIKERKTASVCISSLLDSTKYFGLDLCSNISVPVSWHKGEYPFLPLTGPANYSINIHRSDPKLTTYMLKMNVAKINEFSNKTFLELSTPESTHERILLMNVKTLKTPHRYHWNISVGNHEKKWTKLNFTRDKVSKNLMAELNLTLSNVSLYHMTKLHNPKKIVTSTSISHGPIGHPVSVMFLNTMLNYSTKSVGRMTFSLAHKPLKLTWQVKAAHNFSELSTNISCIMKCRKRLSPFLNHRMVVNITHINKTSQIWSKKISEKGLYLNMQLNETRRLSIFGSKKVVETDGLKLSTYFTNCTYYDRTALNPYTSSLNFTLAEDPFTKWNDMTLNVTYKNNSITLETSMKNSTEKKSTCLRGTYLNGTSWSKSNFTSCLAYLNNTESKNLIWNLTSSKTTHKLKTTWLARPGLAMVLNYTCQDKSLASLKVSYLKASTRKFLGVNGNIENWSLDVQHSFQEHLSHPDRLRRIVIIHKVKNQTEPYLYNRFSLAFFNSTMVKNLLVGMTLSIRNRNETYIKETQENKLWGFVNKTMLWEAGIKNTTDILSVSSLFDYQVKDHKSGYKLVSKQKWNHSLLWDKTNSLLNMSVDLWPNKKLGLNCSGNFATGINVTAHMNDYHPWSYLDHSLQWKAFVSKKLMISHLTLSNRTFMLKTTHKSKSAFLNISTWNQINKTAFNGFISWHLNGVTKKTSLNVNTSLYFTALSHNDSHLKLSFVRRNRSQLYKESNLEFRPGGKLHTGFNVTSLKKLWKELNLKTFDIPRKLLNITVNFTSRGANVKKTGQHLKVLLESITRELTAWKFTQKNLAENLSKLRKHLLKVTSHNLPHVTSDYDVYLKNNQFDVLKFWNNLTVAIVDIPRSEMHSKEIARELIHSLKNISESFDKTRVIGNLSEVLGDIALYNTSGKNTVHLKNLRDNMKFYLQSLTQSIKDCLKNASKDIGAWMIHSKPIDHIKENIPKLKDKVLYVLNETKIIMTDIHGNLRTLRDDVAFLSEHVISQTYPHIYNNGKDIQKKIRVLASPTSFAGGIIHPSWLKLTEMLEISMFNSTIFAMHKHLINGTSMETILHLYSQPHHVAKVFHTSVMDKSLEKVLNRSLVKALEMFNATLRLPSWHLNRTHDKLAYMRDLIVTVFNDTDHVMHRNSDRDLTEIVELYIQQTQNITTNTWNMTKFVMEGVFNVSIPAHKRWETLKKNVTELYWSTSEIMPWARPLLKLWNTTMLRLVKNNTPEEHLRYWMPKFVTFTLDTASHFTKYVNKCLTDEQTKTPRIHVGYSEDILKVSTIHKMESRPNFTKHLFKVAKHYHDFTTSIFNWTKKPKSLVQSDGHLITKKWINIFFSATSEILDVSESVVNGSLVNETINNVTHHYVKSFPKIMELDEWVLNMTMGHVFNKSNIPYYNTWKTMSGLYQMEAHDLATLFTPKNQTAFIINQRTYITFDKRSFRVPEFQKPGCSLLVARDFLERHFTVLATQNSYMIITPESKIEIYKDGRIKANNGISPKLFTDLPVQFDDLYVIRDGPFIRVVSKDRGFEFELEMDHFIFGAYISGFYHNRTLGLLGTNNGEMSDDWRSPLGKNRTDVEKFFNSWLVGSDYEECRVRTQRQQQRCHQKESSRCENLFRSKISPFNKCFSVIDPKPFLDVCIKDMASCEIREPEVQSHCRLSAAYVRECTKNDVIISMPTDCVDCYKETRYMISKREVDIVVISSEGANMEHIAERLPKLIQRLSSKLVNENIDPRFGLVGFSGRPPAHWQGHTHTLDGKFFGSASEFFQAVTTLDYVPYSPYNNISDGYMGIHHATKHPFRPGAKKIFILVTDSRHEPDSRLTSDVVSEAMKNIDAKLIVIGDYRFKKRTYGGDTDGYRYYKDLQYELKHKSVEKLPLNDDYVKVVVKTEGAVFMVKRFESRDKYTQKIFSEMLVNVVLKYSKGKRCMECRCVPNQVGKGQEVCKKTSNFWCMWN